MSDPVKDPEGTEPPKPTRPGEIVVPRWVVLVTFVLGWGAGGSMMVFELTGEGRFQVMLLAAWLIVLPLVAANPLRALGEVLGAAIGTTKK